MQLSIIIINYFSAALLRKCIDSIVNSKPTMDYEIIVVNNSNEKLQVSDFRKNNVNLPLAIIQNKDNVGFGRANNQAAQKAKGHYILFLNVDTEIIDNAI